jgi:hypothetical protein
MAVHSLTSPGGSPGVTTTALALALAWPTQVILAECDPSGGDILAGLFAGHLPATGGLLALALEAARGPDAASSALPRQLTELDGGLTRLLPGISDPRQALPVAPAWTALASALAAQPCDIIADCGRLDAGEGPLAMIAASDTVLMVLRPSLRQVSRAKPRLEMLTQIIGGRERIAVILAGPGTYGAREIRDALGVDVAAELPHDPRTARLLSDGTGSRRSLDARPLMRAARVTARALRDRPAAPSPARPAGSRR